MIFSTFIVVIFSILFGMYLGLRWTKGDDLYLDLSNLAYKVKRMIRRIVKY